MIPSALAKYAADLASLPGDAALGYRNEGLRGVWDAVAARTVHRALRTSRLTVFAQTLEQIGDVPPPSGVTIGRLRVEAVEALAPIAGKRDRERFRRLLEIGCIGLAAWRGEHPVGYAWVAAEMRPEVSHCPLELPPHAAYLWDLYVVPAERGSGLGSALAAERLRIARELGRSEGWRMITPDNTASLRTLRRSGAAPRVVGELRYLKLGSRLFVRFTPCPPPAH
ncbi:MAG TPA: GNAT family N-acetyltransferase [Gemmatimonadales bacterium]|nr:GNAT family N-acetyltransferase [Gemmatimonadales bacterium]